MLHIDFSITQFLPLCKKKTPNLCRFDVFCADCSASVWSEWRESNSRPLEPHSSALPNCATPGHRWAVSNQLVYYTELQGKSQYLFWIFLSFFEICRWCGKEFAGCGVVGFVGSLLYKEGRCGVTRKVGVAVRSRAGQCPAPTGWWILYVAVTARFPLISHLR